MALDLSEKDLADRDVLASKLITLAEIIVRKHFYASPHDKDDLVQTGVLKALMMIESGAFAPEKGKFATFLYTGMRNEMHNYLYHLRKFNCVDIDIVTLPVDENESKDEDAGKVSECYIDYSIIHDVCKDFTSFFGEFIENSAIETFKKIGYEVRGLPPRADHVYYGDRLKNRYGRDIKDDVVGRLVGLVLWNKKQLDERG